MALFAVTWPCVAGNKMKTKTKNLKATYGTPKHPIKPAAVKHPKPPKNPRPATANTVKRPKRQSHG